MKKLSLIKLEEHQLSEKQLKNVQGGSVNWCDCDCSVIGPTNSVSVWQSTPEPGKPGTGNPGGGSGSNWCDCAAFEIEVNNSVSTWHSTPYPR